MAMTQIIWQLVYRPEYLEPLRREAEDAVSQFGFTSKMIEHLHLQDSFIEESNRLYSINKLSNQRMVMDEPFTFHDGLTLPAGTRIAFPVDQFLRDPDMFESLSGSECPDVFDGFRLLRLKEADRRTEDGVNMWKATHAHQRNLVFGYGNHICPGRFFAVRLIKIILTKPFIEYDLRSDWPGHGIPPGLQMEGSVVPHMSARISFRKRQGLRPDEEHN
ncbi:cytochrome P450 [Hypoxylon sp. FL1284]|nr:cytochrome P450 [Hypoxylon sp. FL1284]